MCEHLASQIDGTWETCQDCGALRPYSSDHEYAWVTAYDVFQKVGFKIISPTKITNIVSFEAYKKKGK